jgi:signal-transduction protein with cAMP-binding, CBS, and nucleotidyltransferase domain
MTTLGKILADKEHQIWSIKPDATVFDALKLMGDKNIGAVLVMDGEALVGILSERDYARKVILLGKSSRDTLVSEIMTPRVICMRADQTAEECMALMTEKYIRHLPVLNADNRIIGVVSIGDVGRAIIAQQQFTIAHLEHYIASSEAMFYRSS